MTTKTCAIALTLMLALTLGAVADERVGDPYTLNVCPVTGGELGSMGDPIVIVQDGREIKFCCAGCKPKFEADPAKYIAQIDEQVIAQQLAAYPLDTCLVSGQKLDSKGGQIDLVVNNRHVALCCAGCKAKVKPTRLAPSPNSIKPLSRNKPQPTPSKNALSLEKPSATNQLMWL